MEEQILNLAVAAIVAGGALYFAWRFRHRIREQVAAWLRAQGLQESALMDVLMDCDGLAGSVEKGILCKIFVKTKQTGEQKISEQTYTLEEISKIDPDVSAELEKRGQVRKSILKEVA